MALKDDIKRLENLVKSVNELVRMNLMQDLTVNPNVYVVSEILKLKDEKYMKNWCQNILRVWAMIYKPRDIADVELVVFDKESGNLICKYSEINGLYYEY